LRARNRVDRVTTRLKRDGLGRPTIIRQAAGVQPDMSIADTGSNRRAIGAGAGETAGAVVVDIVAAVGDAYPGAVTAGAAVSQDAVGDGYAGGEVVVVDRAAIAGRRGIARESAVDDRQRALVRYTTAVVGAVAGEGAVGNRQRAAVIDATAVVGAVAGERAVDNRQHAAVFDATAVEPWIVAVGNRELVESDGGARAHREHTVFIGAVYLNHLPGAINRQAELEIIAGVVNRRKRAGQYYRAADAEIDGVRTQAAEKAEKATVTAGRVEPGVGVVDRLAQTAKPITRSAVIAQRCDCYRITNESIACIPGPPIDAVAMINENTPSHGYSLADS